jgi:hypothetical protein
MRSLHSWPTFPLNLDPPSARSLTLLFIIQEWISSLQQLEEFRAISPNQSIPSLLKGMEKLLHFSRENPFPKKGGFLDRLCFYSEILLQASRISDESIPIILEEMLHFILSFKAKLLASKKRPVPGEELQAQAGILFQVLEQKFHAFFTALVPFLQEARTDENVLIFLLEKKHILNRYLGSRAIEEMLHSFFPAGLSQVRAVICEGFTRRGFTSFLAEKESLIEELEWEAPCQPPPAIL